MAAEDFIAEVSLMQPTQNQIHLAHFMVFWMWAFGKNKKKASD
jgi:hypothetical protein